MSVHDDENVDVPNQRLPDTASDENRARQISIANLSVAHTRLLEKRISRAKSWHPPHFL